MADPAAVYCHELGYEYQVVDGAKGQYGVCDFPDGSSCDAWRFLEGMCGQGYSYCAKQGYGLITKTDGKDSLSRAYSVCVQGQQEIGSVTELMRLSEKATKGSVRPEQSPVPPAESPSAESKAPSAPSSFDWRSYNGQDWMTSVKDQGGCGSCWAFSAVGIVEPVYNISTNDSSLDLDLSEEYLVSDCHSYGGYETCCGGSNDEALNFIRDSGISDEACFPYVDGLSCTCGTSCNTDCTYRTWGKCSDATCLNRCANWASRLTRIQATGPVNASVSSIKDKLVEKGPLSVCFGFGSEYGGNFDAQDVYRCTNDSGTNHCVVIAGYDDDGRYWILKNSWGSSWNGDEQGYFKLGYGECYVEQYVYYADAPSCPGQYQLTMQVSPPGAGTTTPSVGGHCYNSGTVVPISASANSGWQFTGWSGDADCSDGSVTVNSNKTCLANFSHAGCNTYTSTDVPKSIPDLTTVTSTLNVGSSFALTDVNAGPLNITHTYDADLDVFLISPHGTRVELFTDVGGSGDNFTNTVLDDECATSIASGAAPFTGCYRPEGSLSALDGQSSAGVWTLEVTDDYAVDTGTLQSWQLELCGAATPTPTPIPSTPTPTPTPGTPTPTPTWSPDTDGDTVPDSVDNCPSVANPGQENTDAAIDNGPGVPGNDGTVPNAIADGQGDACETDPDIDHDGLPDAQDTNPLGATGICAAFNGRSDGHPHPAGGDVTNDDDHDGDPAFPMGDDTSDNGPSWDTDNDGFLDGYECLHGSNPRDVNSKPAALVDDNADNDGDGLRNGWERRGWGTSPTLVDSDGDGLGDCKEAADVNGNGVVDFVEDTMFYARAVLLPRASFGKTMDFDLDKNGVADFGGDLLQEARYAFHILPCQ